MKIILSVLFFVTALAWHSVADDSLAQETGKLISRLAQTEKDLRSAKTNTPSGILRHVVALKFKQGASTEEIKKVENAFHDLKNKIPGIAALEWGTNVSPEKHAKGFTHCFILGFKSDKDRDAYLVHPEHKKFGKILGPVMDDVFVIDFWAKE